MSQMPKVSVDFLDPQRLYRLKSATRKDPLLRAVGIKAHQPIRVIDATAGFGKDACLLAYFGAQVLMLERVQAMAELLAQGLRAAQMQGELMTLAARMSLMHVDAKQYLQQLSSDEYPDVIYLDPMFIHHKKSALPNKEMQFLQAQTDDSDAGDLLTCALLHARSRVVVKRSLRAAPLTDVQPDFAIKSKLLRFDVYLIDKP